MKLILSTIVGGIVLFILGWVFYVLVFGSFITENFGKIMRSPDDYKLWAVAAANFLQALFLAWIYPKGYKGGSPAKEGFMFGIAIGLLTSVPYVFFLWAQYPVKWQAAVVDGVSMLIMTIIAGLVIGLIYGRIGAKKEGTA